MGGVLSLQGLDAGAARGEDDVGPGEEGLVVSAGVDIAVCEDMFELGAELLL